jgi:hypothetical protein
MLGPLETIVEQPMSVQLQLNKRLRRGFADECMEEHVQYLVLDVYLAVVEPTLVVQQLFLTDPT